MFCLRATVRPLIERITKAVAASDVRGDFKEFSSNVAFILREAGQVRHFSCLRLVSHRGMQLLEELEQSIAFFPIEIREGFVVLSREVAKKFPQTTNAVSVVLFLRFICPSILQAHAFKIVDGSLGCVCLLLSPLTKCAARSSFASRPPGVITNCKASSIYRQRAG